MESFCKLRELQGVERNNCMMYANCSNHKKIIKYDMLSLKFPPDIIYLYVFPYQNARLILISYQKHSE